MTMHTYTFHVSGTHCASCKILIEDTLKAEGCVRDARVDLWRELLEVEVVGEAAPEALAHLFTEKVKANGYRVSLERSVAHERDRVLWKAVPLGLGFLALFFWLQTSGILNIGLGGPVTPPTAFVIGLIASVSSCLAVVGGLVLSLATKLSRDSANTMRTFVLFHAGRLIAFAALGGVLGAIGGAIGINPLFTGILGLVASTAMLLVGLDLVGVFERHTLTLPSGMFRRFRGVEHGAFAPFTLGFATFFLPCGFTQSMQLSALSSGSFGSGLLILLAFALGTLPMLMLLSFGSASFARGTHAPLFFKSAGVVVVGLGLFALLSGLAGLGLIDPLVNL